MISKSRFRKGVVISPDTDALESIEGEIKVDSADGKLKATLGGAAREVLTNSQSATLTNKTIDADSNTITNIENANIKAGAAIDASKLADGSVSNAEFQYLSGVTSDIQTQINTASGAAGTAQTDINNHIADAVDAHDASAISSIPSGNLAATEVQAALNELQSDIDTRATASALTAHINNATDAHDASAISNIPSGNLAATEVQAALNELQSDIDTRALNSNLTAHTGASTGVHGVTGSVVGTSDSQTLTNKTITGADIRTPVRSDVKQDTKANLVTYALTASNGQFVFATDSKEMLQVVDGVLVAVGSGSGAGNVDALLTQTFDTASLGDFTQTGLALVSSNTINGLASAQLIHQAASSRSFKQVKAVDRKYRGELMQLSLEVRSSASEGNLTLLVTDETNATTLMASSPITTGQIQVATAVTTNASATVTGFSSSVINSLRVGMSITGAGIPTATVINSINSAAGSIVMSQNATASATITAKISSLPARRTFSFTLPANCASFSYTVTALQEAGSPESYVDDIVVELASTALLSTSVTVPVITEWQAYTPTFQGFGTPTGVEAQWRQNGGNHEYRVKFAAGTPTAVEARVGLANGATSASTNLIPSIQLAGHAARSAFATTYFTSEVLIEPSVSYFTFGTQTQAVSSITKANGSGLINPSETFSFFASVPVLGLSATTTRTIPLTQAGVVQDADSYVRITGFTPSVGATATKIISIASGSITQNIGDAVQYLDDSTNGARFIAQKAGTYRFGFSADVNNTTPTGMGFSLNSSSLTTNYSTLPASQKIQSGYEAGGSSILSMYGEAYLNVGDTVRIHLDGSLTSPSNSWSTFTASYQGSLRQVTVNPNSKITIPTSELRFEGASSRGAVATAIVKFDTLARIRGDAFTVTNTANDGTFITMLKAGRLDVSVNLYYNSTSFQASITKNQSVLTSASLPPSEFVGTSFCNVTSVANVSGTTDVKVGDIIRVTANLTPTGDIVNNLNLSFQEQSIQVGITNILPQFSESDSTVELNTSNGYGSSGTRVIRFSNLVQNLGSDIQYVDSAANGGSFTVASSGVYNIAAQAIFTTQTYFAITRNASSLSTDASSLSTTEQLRGTLTPGANQTGTVSWQGNLNQGDVVRLMSNSATLGTAAFTGITMSKVGKPNVTGVNVTPFVNVPQPDNQAIVVSNGNGYGSTATKIRRFSVVPKNTSNGIIAYSDSATNGASFTALKRCSVTVTFADRTAAAGVDIGLSLNSTTLTTGIDSLSPPVLLAFVRSSASVDFMQVSWTGIMEAGDVLRPHNGTTNTTADAPSVTLSLAATALSDQILTVPETFSTDTAALTYASSAAYTLATLANAPVGTFITFTYAASTSTRTQTTTRPTQTDADMNTNGVLITARNSFGVASVAATPSLVVINVGKGHKGSNLALYAAANKSQEVLVDYYVNVNNARGLIRTYDPKTGLLTIDAGFVDANITQHDFLRLDSIVTVSSAYAVFDASKNPALTGMNLNRVAARGVNSSAQSIPNSTVTTITYDATKTFDTNGALNSATGVWTCPETGYYQISGGITSASVSWTSGQVFELALTRNGTQVSSYISPISTGSYTASTQVSDTLFFSRGDTVTMTAFHNRGAATALLADASRNKLSISKVSI